MQRFITIVLAGLSVAIVLAVGSVTWRAATVPHVSSQIESADAAIGFAFYAGLDRVLADGSRADLDRTVSSDFVDHAGGTTTARSADELVDQLTSFGETFPGVQLRPRELFPAGSSLIAELPPITTAATRVAGLVLAPTRISGGIEVLRIRRGKVSERWSVPLPAVSVTTVAAASHSYSQGGALSARLFRIDLPPGGELRWRTDDLSVAMVETGTLAITTEEADELGTPVTQKETLVAGAAELLRPGAQIRFRSDSAQVTQLLLFAADRLDSRAPMPFRLEGGAKSKLIWNTYPLFDVTAPWRLEVGRIVVPSTGDVTLGNPSGAGIVLTMQDAPMTLTIDNGKIEHLDEKYAISRLDSPAALAPGGAALLVGADDAMLRTTTGESSAVWLVTIGPIVPSGVENGDPAFELNGPPGRPS